jgi:hypothetical protein
VEIAADASRFRDKLDPAGSGHLHVREQGRDIRLFLQNAEGAAGRKASDYTATHFFEHANREIEDQGIVVDNENKGRHHNLARSLGVFM